MSWTRTSTSNSPCMSTLVDGVTFNIIDSCLDTPRRLSRYFEAATSGFCESAYPNLPVDPFLLPNDGSTVLGTVSSEHHAYLRLSAQEANRWLAW